MGRGLLGSLALPDIKTYHKALIIKIVWYQWRIERTTSGTEFGDLK